MRWPEAKAMQNVVLMMLIGSVLMMAIAALDMPEG